MSMRKKFILAFIIINFAILLGFAVLFLVSGIQISQESHEYEWMNGYFNLFISPRFYYFLAVMQAVFAIIELFSGIFTYFGKKWAAGILIVFAAITWVAILGAVAAIIALVPPRDNTEQT